MRPKEVSGVKWSYSVRLMNNTKIKLFQLFVVSNLTLRVHVRVTLLLILSC
jgi:hypothetical protein